MSLSELLSHLDRYFITYCIWQKKFCYQRIWKASSKRKYKFLCCVAELLTHYGASSPKFSICHSEAVTGLIRGREQIRIPRLISSLWLSNSAGLCGTNTLQCIRTTWIRAWWRLRIYASNCCGSSWINLWFMSSCLLSNICCCNTESVIWRQQI